MKKSHFIITTRGKTGSFWVANALDMHPDIVCSHSCLNAAASWLYNDGWSDHHARGMRWKEPPPAPLAKILTRYHGYEVESQSQIFYKRSLNEFMDLQESIDEAKYYGNVHGYTAKVVINKAAKCPPDRPLKIANLLRHPVRIVNSGINRGYRAGPEKRREFIARFAQEVKYYAIEPIDSNLNFMINVSHLDDYLAPLRCDRILQIPLERFTKDGEFFCYVLRYLTSESLDIPRSYLERIMNHPRINKHSDSNSAKLTSEQIFASWQAWQKDFMLRKLNEFSDVFPRLEELGYQMGQLFSSRRFDFTASKVEKR